MRSEALLKLLKTVKTQSLYPNEILIVDGSVDDATKTMLQYNDFEHLKYYKVDDNERGLTKQRNYGVKNVSKDIEIICFLDDDVLLEPTYFEHLLETYNTFSEALGVGGYITNEVIWRKKDNTSISSNKFYYEEWEREEPMRFKVRRKLGLSPDTPAGFLPTFSHGRSISFLPPSGKTYKVEQLMGGVSSFKRDVFEMQQFSTYFEGYGLYEDADFSLRLAKKGNLYVNTKARLEHHHAPSGRPNVFKYGKMVARNGWYVWRVKYANPSFKAKIKWNATLLLLTFLTFFSALKNRNKHGIIEGFGRLSGWLSLLGNKPKIIED
jgi:glycosyltransferase involved in cell wall biosynthesis